MKTTTASKKIFVILAAVALFGGCLAIFSPHPPSCGARTLWDMQEGLGADGGAGAIGRAFGETGDQPTDFRDVIVTLIKIFLTFTGIILIIIIIIAGYQWMTAGGSADRVREAQARIRNAIIGIIIVLAAYTITNFVSRCVLDILSDSHWMCRIL